LTFTVGCLLFLMFAVHPSAGIVLPPPGACGKKESGVAGALFGALR
jgi:hypothetical protein